MRPTTRLLPCLVLVVTICGCELEEGSQPVSSGDVTACLPPDGAVQGLKLAVTPTKFASADLAKRLGAEADVYTAYGFDCGASARYTNAWSKAEGEDAEIQVDIFRMRDPAAAFGAYSYQSHGLEPPVRRRPIGAGATIGALGGHLWKADCYVKVETKDKSPEGRDMVRKILKHVARRISGESPQPPVLASLPPGMCNPDRVRFFTNKASLDIVHWVADDDVLALGKSVEGAVAETADGEATAFVVRYPDGAAALTGWRAYRKFLESKGGGTQGPIVIAEHPAGVFCAASLKDTCVAGVWEAKTSKAATGFATRVFTHLGGKLPPPPPKPTTRTPSSKAAATAAAP